MNNDEREKEYESMGMSRLARRNVVVFTITTLLLGIAWLAKALQTEQRAHDETRAKLLLCKDDIRSEVNKITADYIKFIKEKTHGNGDSIR